MPIWWMPVLKKMAGIPGFKPHDLLHIVPFVKQLSSHLNDVDQRRNASSSYMRDKRLREAYLLYYVTSNLLKLLWPLQELWPAGPPAVNAKDVDTPFRVLDVGCGPGTGIAAMHAWRDAFPGPRPIHVKGIDSVHANAVLYREMGQVIREHSGHTIECDAMAGDARHLEGDSGQYDLVMGMNVLNEIPEPARPRFLQRCAELLAPSGALILIEPALRATSRGLLQLRDLAVQEGWTVAAPCFRQGSCPALVNEKDWCHHDLHWNRPDFIAWLDEEIGNIKRSLKFSCVVLQRDENSARTGVENESPLRVVSELFVEKGRSWCFGCGESGRRVYQRNRRDRSDTNAAFDDLQRYDAIVIRGEEDREHDVRIPSDAEVRRW
ncbi:MAG: small ribosomal subunit Rsm22 family protein [Bacteroidota bacterium]